jgi:hypothetical protein
MIARVLVIAIITALSACVIASSSPRLTAAEATRIAERKAEASAPHRLSEYTGTPARYDRADDAWWVSYSPKHPDRNPFSHGFNIEVKDKTREAWLVLP